MQTRHRRGQAGGERPRQEFSWDWGRQRAADSRAFLVAYLELVLRDPAVLRTHLRWQFVRGRRARSRRSAPAWRRAVIARVRSKGAARLPMAEVRRLLADPGVLVAAHLALAESAPMKPVATS